MPRPSSPSSVPRKSNHYFDNEKVEKLLTEYVEGACTERLLRAVNLAKKFHQLLHYRSIDNVDELASVAWAQIPTLVCMAYMKKETRDACAVRSRQDGRPAPALKRREVPDFYAAMEDLREACAGNELHLQMVDYLVELYENEEWPWIGLARELGERFGKTVAREFLEEMRELHSQVLP